MCSLQGLELSLELRFEGVLTLGVRGWLIVPVVRMMRELERSGSPPVRIARGFAHKCAQREWRDAAHSLFLPLEVARRFIIHPRPGTNPACL